MDLCIKKKKKKNNFETSAVFFQISMGVLKKNEQYNEEMTDICMFLNQYVPGAREENDPRAPENVLSGGDYLTFERHKQAQSAKRNGRTPMKRMEGLVPNLEGFHNQAEFLQVSALLSQMSWYHAMLFSRL